MRLSAPLISLFDIISFQFMAITCSVLSLLPMSLLIWVAINFASLYFPTLFRCNPCSVKYSLLGSIYTNSGCLNGLITLFNFASNAWIVKLILESIVRSCLRGIFTTIMYVFLYFCITRVITYKTPIILTLLLSISLESPFITITSFLPRLLSSNSCSILSGL